MEVSFCSLPNTDEPITEAHRRYVFPEILPKCEIRGNKDIIALVFLGVKWTICHFDKLFISGCMGSSDAARDENSCDMASHTL